MSGPGFLERLHGLEPCLDSLEGCVPTFGTTAETTKATAWVASGGGASGRTRTLNNRCRRSLLYPVELRTPESASDPSMVEAVDHEFCSLPKSVACGVMVAGADLRRCSPSVQSLHRLREVPTASQSTLRISLRIHHQVLDLTRPRLSGFVAVGKQIEGFMVHHISGPDATPAIPRAACRLDGASAWLPSEPHLADLRAWCRFPTPPLM